ncbi:nuclear exosome regulator NRDE2-like isoform X2 [Dysidea avara]|uniref:nuclear exosome regulator NRDE2-like isoform X2 n=1 Tax=Dysidea avara TaxID=196820 RepID=UPI00332EBA19
MALFPAAFSSVDQAEKKDAIEDDQLDWLKNKSYNEPTNELLYGESGRKRHKHSEKKSKKLKESPENEAKPTAVIQPKAVWLEDVGLKPELAYRFDRAPDIDNARYGGLYSADIARYRRHTNYCVGLQDEINYTDSRGRQMSKKHKKSGSSRYFKSSLSKQQDTMVYTSTKDDTFEWKESFISIKKTEEQQPSDENQDTNTDTPEWYVTQKAKAYNQSLAEDPSDVSLWLEFIKFQDEALLWGCVPGVDLQGDGGNSKKQNRVALIERKMAIFEKAMQTNPLSVDLIKGYMALCEEVWDHDKMVKSWRDTVFKLPHKASLWVDYILYCQRQFSFFTVSQLCAVYAKGISMLSSLHEGVLRSHTPDADIEESMVSIIALFCIFLRNAGHTEKAVALYQALLEFNLCCPPSLSADITIREAIAFLEPFWDSGAARIGEVGAVGWKNWVERESDKERGTTLLGLVQLSQVWNESDTKVTEVGTNDDQEMELVHEHPLSESWINLETFRESQHHLPWKLPTDSTADTSEDPDRLVLFDDITPYLFRVKTEESRLLLLLHFLNFLGVSTPAVASNCCVHHHVMHALLQASQIAPPTTASTVSAMIKNFKTFQGSAVPIACCTIGSDLDGVQLDDIQLETLQNPSAHHSVCFIRNLLNQCLPLFSSQNQTVVAQNWLGFELSIAKHATPKEAKKKIKCVKKLAKALLKLQAHRNNVQLWCNYAHLELTSEGRNDAIKVCEKILSQCTVDIDSNSSIPVLHMYLYLIGLILCDSDGEELSFTPENVSYVKHVLVCLTEGNYHVYSTGSSAISAPKSLSAQNKLLQACQKALKMLSDTSTLLQNGNCLQRYSFLMSCFLHLNSILSGLSNTCKIVKEHCEQFVNHLSTMNISSYSICHLEKVFMTSCKLILSQSRSQHCSPQLLHVILENSLKLYPNNPYFLNCFIESEKRCFVTGRLRRYFDTVASQNNMPSSWLYAIKAEWLRYQTLKSHQTRISIDEPVLGIIHRIRSLFYRASQAPNGRCCVLLWRLYMFEHGDETSTSAVFYQAIRLCPGVKVLYLDAVRYLPTELTKITEIMEEKELRIRAPVDEVKLLQELSEEDSKLVQTSHN